MNTLNIKNNGYIRVIDLDIGNILKINDEYYTIYSLHKNESNIDVLLRSLNESLSNCISGSLSVHDYIEIYIVLL